MNIIELIESVCPMRRKLILAKHLFGYGVLHDNLEGFEADFSSDCIRWSYKNMSALVFFNQVPHSEPRYELNIITNNAEARSFYKKLGKAIAHMLDFQYDINDLVAEQDKLIDAVESLYNHSFGNFPRQNILSRISIHEAIKRFGRFQLNTTSHELSIRLLKDMAHITMDEMGRTNSDEKVNTLRQSVIAFDEEIVKKYYPDYTLDIYPGYFKILSVDEVPV